MILPNIVKKFPSVQGLMCILIRPDQSLPSKLEKCPRMGRDPSCVFKCICTHPASDVVFAFPCPYGWPLEGLSYQV